MAKGLPKTGEWGDTESVMRALGISQRTVQKYAQLGWLGHKTMREGRRHYRLYDMADVAKLQASGPPRTLPDGTDEAGQQETRLVFAPSVPARLPTRRNFSFSLPEGRVAASFPLALDAEGLAEARAFFELVLRQLAPRKSLDGIEG